MQVDQLVYYIALGQIPGVGNIIAKNLVAYVGSAEGVFKESNKNLQKIPKVGPVVADAICSNRVLDKAMKEVEFVVNNNIHALVYSHENYPLRLKECDDAPVVLFVKGSCDLNARKSVAVVGTRSATSYGKDLCKQIVTGLKQHDALVVSGLAYGIDIVAHKTALDLGLDTVAVMGTSLDTIYPSDHRDVARDIARQGALISELCHHTPTDKSHFVKRNRMIAGLADAVIIVESGIKGGALLTAEYALSYNREVLACPGRGIDRHSLGCNNLIKRNKAALVESIDDLEYVLNWHLNTGTGQQQQTRLMFDLSADEELVLDALTREQMLNIDLLSLRTNLPMSKVSTLLLNLEFNGLVKCFPGKVFARV